MATVALAATVCAGCASADATGLGFGALLARSLGALVVVAGLAVVVLRLAARAGVGTSSTKRLQVLARSGVAPRSEVVAVAVADRVVVVGITPAGMQPLTEMPRRVWDASDDGADDDAFDRHLAAPGTADAARRLASTGALDPGDEVRLEPPDAREGAR